MSSEVIFDIDTKLKRVLSLENEITGNDFWNNQEYSQKIVKELKNLKSVIEPFLKIEQSIKDIRDIVGIAGPEDTESLQHFKEELSKISLKVDSLEFRTLLSGENDPNNAILTVNAGAGGTEACDWAAMLLRMYTMWAESKGYEVSWLDQCQGEEAGIKNATFLIKGDYAYGYLKSESGVHRLVRISPFDSNKRRHTSFASIDILPELSDEIKIDIKEADLKIDTFRAGGKGGQHVNKTDSAVRITHIPTGIITQCQNERSQFKNKSMAMKLLRAKLYEKEQQKKASQVASSYESKKDIEWGSQIRSYVLHPYKMVKDHRTGFEVGNADAVLDGKLDGFIEAYLKGSRKDA
jgi:peptide chain release factor 2